ncbi:hypothetical protein [Gordonia polyisoprenivorans]|uniref:hypothetical protein n=1 Tax=Gordonia polyisoprenivorans TaxID=84595 RepID=UPI001AD65114|nr:hypothetical protein [Gordonia polyisoprenivorans]QTI68377.1 hypothetical protein J6U32_23255 [Gordonia polyisoprenivorans]
MSVSRRIMAPLIAVVALSMGLSACGDDSTSTTVTAPTSSAGAIDTPTSSALSGAWTGTWTSVGETKSAQLGVVTDKPFLATIDIPGRCGATWKETSRDATHVVVTATVTYGQCSDNEWQLTVSDQSISAVDTSDPETRAQFRRS